MLKRFLGKRLRTFAEEKEEIEQQVFRIQKGDEELRNRLITEYQPFICKVVSKVCKRYIDPSQDDEFSIGLLAFDEAIQSFAPGKGSSFLSFADLVIRRRVIDFVRKETRQRVSLTLDERGEEEERTESEAEIAASLHRYELDREAEHRREEILHFEERLREFGIAFAELPEQTPKHADARENALSIARLVATDQNLKKAFLQTKKLPIKELVKKVHVSRKTVERNRKYIVAMSLILIEDYVYLREYLSPAFGEKKGGNGK
ncbi:RNA polymerase sigma factor SigI [Bacillaceae bacterium]